MITTKKINPKIIILLILTLFILIYNNTFEVKAIEGTGQTEETQEETNEENYIVEENPEGGISLLIDYTASKKITTTSGEEIYIPEEILQYKYIFINRSSNVNSYYIYAANEIEYITGTSNRIKFTEAIKLQNTNTKDILNTMLKENTIYTATIYETTTITCTVLSYQVLTNYEFKDSTGSLIMEPNLIIETEETETPEEPETNTDYTEQLKEVNANLQKIQEINTSILIMFSILFIYMFTSSMFRGK